MNHHHHQPDGWKWGASRTPSPFAAAAANLAAGFTLASAVISLTVNWVVR